MKCKACGKNMLVASVLKSNLRFYVCDLCGLMGDFLTSAQQWENILLRPLSKLALLQCRTYIKFIKEPNEKVEK